MYSVGGSSEELVLRPEGTAAVLRAHLGGGGHRGGVARSYYAGPMFRHERPQAGRLRQFTQVGAEVLGAAGPGVDAEVIGTAWRSVRCALDTLAGGAAPPVEVLVNSLGTAQERQSYTADLAVYLAAHAEALSPGSRAKVQSGHVLGVLDSKAPQDASVLEHAPMLPQHWGADTSAEWEQLTGTLQRWGVPFRHTPGLVRGLDYYNGTAFEVVVAGGGSGRALTLAGGGRYDALATALGARAPLPAVGWAAGLERLLALTGGAEKDAPPPSTPLITVTPLEAAPEVLALAQDAAFALQGVAAQHGWRVVAPVTARKAPKAIAAAASAGASVAVLVGQAEAAVGSVALRHLHSRQQVTVPVHEAEQSLQRLLR